MSTNRGAAGPVPVPCVQCEKGKVSDHVHLDGTGDAAVEWTRGVENDNEPVQPTADNRSGHSVCGSVTDTSCETAANARTEGKTVQDMFPLLTQHAAQTDQNMQTDSNVSESSNSSFFQIMSWNVQGLVHKLKNRSFRKFCERFQMFGLCEIWSCTQADIENAFPDYKVLFSPRKCRLKGGVAVCIRKSIEEQVEQLCCAVEDSVFLKINSVVVNSVSDILAAFVYVAPERSMIYGEDNKDGIEVLENHVAEITSAHPDLPWLLCGDFNARTAGLSDADLPDEEGMRHAQPLQDLIQVFDDVPQTARQSKDTSSNNFGRKLIDLCREHDWFIVNGRKPGDLRGEITCVANRGRSVVDYFIGAMPVHDLITDMFVVDRSESDHFPIVARLHNVACISGGTDSEEELELHDVEKFVWKESNTESFLSYIHDNVESALESFMSALEVGVEEGSRCLVSFIQRAACKMRSRQSARAASTQPAWWDQECQQVKEDKYRKLKLFRQTNSQTDLDSFLEAKQSFKKLCHSKADLHDAKLAQEVKEACDDNKNSKAFWQKVKFITTGKKLSTDAISPRSWYDYFCNLLNVEINTNDSGFSEEVKDVLNDHDESRCEECQHLQLDGEITQSEVLKAIHGMKKGKASGPDGLPSDFFHHAENVLVKFLHPLFNKVFQSGDYPQSWTEGVIFPLHKKGNPRNVDNYRGISLLNVISKLYSSVINSRLNSFCDETDCIPEAQAGFRKGYSTIDNIFCLQSLVQKYLTKQGGRFYTLFVDFSKAYDSVHREKLLYLLLKKGVHGKLFSTLESMYRSVKAAVRVGSKVTDYFECMSGLRQGCIVSPILFSMFLSELQAELYACGGHGVDIFGDPLGVFLLMYADDLALVADSVSDLQKKIDCLEQYCNKWGLVVNMEKTKVVVFKNGGFIKKCERWFFSGQSISVEPSYTYLGVIFSSTLNWAKCIENLRGKALRAVAGVKKLYFRLKTLPADTIFHIFDMKVKPILLYGSEIWGFQRNDDLERVHVKVCKMVLGVGRDVKNHIALGECGRFPVYVEVYTRIVKYWCRLLHMHDSRYPKQCYQMLMLHDISGRKNWASQVRKLLCRHGFGFVWEMQSVGNVNMFISSFRDRLMDHFRQDWHDSLANYTEYLDYHPEILRAEYVVNLEAYEHRRAICLLRCNRLPLNGVVSYTSSTVDRECKLCDYHQVEDACHFLLICPRYATARKKFIPMYYYRFPSAFKVQLLCANLKGKLLYKIAVYVTDCLKIRNIHSSSH